MRAVAGGSLLPVRVVPRASRTGLAGVRARALLVRLTAPPVEGAANAALLAYLAGLLQQPPSTITLVSGASARQKLLRVDGLPPAGLLARLAPALAGAAG